VDPFWLELLSDLIDSKEEFKRVVQKQYSVKLESLPAIVELVRTVGESLAQKTEDLDKLASLVRALRKEQGGIDATKRIKEAEHMEKEQRRRLQEIQKRFERVERGAGECDGYTSNAEEGTFIEAVIEEMPEFIKRQENAVVECDEMRKLIKDIRESLDEEEEQEEALSDLEERSGLNEKRVSHMEKIADKLEEHFAKMDVAKKLKKRENELNEIENICDDFACQLRDLEDHLRNGLDKMADGLVESVGSVQI